MLYYGGVGGLNIEETARKGTGSSVAGVGVGGEKLPVAVLDMITYRGGLPPRPAAGHLIADAPEFVLHVYRL